MVIIISYLFIFKFLYEFCAEIFYSVSRSSVFAVLSTTFIIKVGTEIHTKPCLLFKTHFQYNLIFSS
jgi:hypothetical protein